MSEKPTAWWHNVAGTHWALLSKAGTLGSVSERDGDYRGDMWEWAVFQKPTVRGTAKSGDEARAAVSRELARRRKADGTD